MSHEGERAVPTASDELHKEAGSDPTSAGVPGVAEENQVSAEAAPPPTPPQPGTNQSLSNPGSASHPSSAPRYPHSGGRAPEGYYQPVYPPPGDGSAPPYPPPRGYEGAPPYGIPPPHMAGYPPMYNPYQPPMYPHYPGYPPPPMPYGYPPPDPNMVHGGGYLPPDGTGVGPAGYAKKDDDDKADDMGDDEEGEDIVPGAVTARLKTYIKPRIPTTQDVLDRRARKNAQSRARAAKLRQRVVEIEKKPEEDRTEEEREIFAQFEHRRQRKNDRSRERALEKKEEIDRILAKSEKKRTKIEKQFLDNALGAKKRKNEGDRLRRQRLKQMGISSKTGLKGAGGHMGRSGYQHYQPYSAPPHMGEIPMSPMPMGGHHSHMQSPGGFGSPGMMHGMGYPSPHRRSGGSSGVMETPGRSGPGGNMPYMPPSNSYENQGSPGSYPQSGGGSGSRVEQRRHPDGSMSISIGGNGATGGSNGSAGGEEQVNMSDVSHLLLYDNPEEGEGQMQGEEANKDGI